MDDTLRMQVHKALQYLGNVDGDEVFWEFTEPFADRLQRAVLAVSRNVSVK